MQLAITFSADQYQDHSVELTEFIEQRQCGLAIRKLLSLTTEDLRYTLNQLGYSIGKSHNKHTILTTVQRELFSTLKTGRLPRVIIDKRIHYD